MKESNELNDNLKTVKHTYNIYTNEKFSIPQNDNLKEVPSEEVKSVKELKQETQQAVKNVQVSVGKDRIEKLINISEDSKKNAFSLKVNDQIGKLSDVQEANLVKKIEEWKVPSDVSEVNAAVVLKWLDNIK